jgi:hypothetical protein
MHVTKPYPDFKQRNAAKRGWLVTIKDGMWVTNHRFDDLAEAERFSRTQQPRRGRASQVGSGRKQSAHDPEA